MASIISAGTTSGTSLNLSGDTSGVLQLATNGSTTAVTIDTSQRVGIGTASPATKAEISGTAAASNLALRITNTATDGYSTLQLGDANAGVYRNGSSQSGYAGASSLNLITVGAHNIGFSTQNTLRAIIDSSGSVGIGTSTPSSFGKLVVKTSSTSEAAGLAVMSSANDSFLTIYNSGSVHNIGATYSSTGSYQPIAFVTSGSERMRITSGGDVQIGTTNITNGGFSFEAGYNGAGKSAALFGHITGTGSGNQYCIFYYDGTIIGSITQNGTTAVAYNTTSDYRLKENIAPMTNALAKVAQLKPVTYTWKADGSDGQGFIAHELQAVVPDAVTGEKDAVDKDGKPTYQGVDTSYLVATLTAAIQELKAELDATKAEVQALKGVA